MQGYHLSYYVETLVKLSKYFLLFGVDKNCNILHLVVRDICTQNSMHEYFIFFLIIVGNVLSCLHQSEYQGGVSAWNFDIQDLKAQESLKQHSF